MTSKPLVRQELPAFDVYIQSEDRTLLPASDMLAQDVRADLGQTRDRIVAAFGSQSLPSLQTDTRDKVYDYFAKRAWSIPQSVVIDPDHDALELRDILLGAAFPSLGDQEFFTGANGQVLSPGGSVSLDAVIFHDLRAKYREDVSELISGWGYAIDDNALEHVAELKLADLVTHELSHLAGGLAVSAVVVGKTDGKYCMTDRVTAGFTDVRDDIPAPQFDEGTDYYSGPALDEAWAALNASRLVLALEGYDKPTDLDIEDRYNIGATLNSPDGAELYYTVSGLHSAEAGMILERLDEEYPGVITLMKDVADGRCQTPAAVDKLKSTFPTDVMRLLNVPQYSAWQDLRSQLSI